MTGSALLTFQAKGRFRLPLYSGAPGTKESCTHLAFCLQMNKATTATSMPIRNSPALTPSMTPNKGSTGIRRTQQTQAGELVLKNREES